MDKTKRISSIFEKIFLINVCGKDPLKVRRDISKVNLNSNVMVIAEAMAPEQVRLSGINYYFKNGEMGSTGKQLEKFLNKVNRTVDYRKSNCIYHTEVVHSFPGYTLSKGKKTIKRPTEKEIQLSLESNILKDEIEVIKPKLILLLGNTAYQSFYKYFLKVSPKINLTAEIERVSNDKKYHKYMNIPIIPLQHSSGANPRFNSMLKNEKLISLINSLLG